MYSNPSFYRRIDQFTISAGSTRTSCQIDNDAILVAYYPFNTLDTLNDYSVNQYNGMAYGTVTLSQGVFGQALNFPYNTSYFQARCLPSTATANYAYTFSIWINPTTTNGGGSIIHISSLQTGGGTCYDSLVLASTGELIAQWMQNSATVVNNIKGPVLPNNTWTHAAVVLSATNGLRLYINGQLYVTSSSASSISIQSFSNAQYITLGNNSPLGPSGGISCLNGTNSVMPGAFSGSIDEFRIYNHELNGQEICVLANL